MTYGSLFGLPVPERQSIVSGEKWQQATETGNLETTS